MDADLFLKLAAPFEVGEVKFKPQAVKGDRALAVAFVDARLVMDRLDEVLTPAGWADSYVLLPDQTVECRLSIKFADGWITKADVGAPSEQPDSGDRMKSAYSDALKRAAVKFGVGRYLYRLPLQWVAFDSQRRQFAEPPRLPDWALAGLTGPQLPTAPPVRVHAKALEDAESADQLKAAWEKISSDARLTGDQKKALAQLKDERKATLAA